MTSIPATGIRNRPILNGDRITVKELARRAGCFPATASARLRLGWSPEEVVDGARRIPIRRLPQKRQPHPNSLNTLAKQHGMKRETLGRRIKSGMTLAVALAKPVQHFDMSPLQGRRFGHLTVGATTKTNRTGKRFYGAQCDCGRTRFVSRSLLLSGDGQTCLSRSCPHFLAFRADRAKHYPSRRLRNSLVGKRFGHFLVTTHLRKGFYLADCDCGTTNFKVHRDTLLRRNSDPSCGCAAVWTPSVGEQIGKMEVRAILGVGKNRTILVFCEVCQKEVDVNRLVLSRRRMLISLGREAGSCGCCARRKLYLYKGEEKILTEIAKEEEVPIGGLWRRIRKGVPLVRAITEARVCAAKYAKRRPRTIFGIPVTSAQLAALGSVKPATMEMRLRSGWTIEEALSGMRKGKRIARVVPR